MGSLRSGRDKQIMSDHSYCGQNNTGASSLQAPSQQTESVVLEVENKQDNVLYDVNRRLEQFWPAAKAEIEALDRTQMREASRRQELPLARIKKIMKLDEDVRQQMISAEAPLLLAKAAELFIQELTLRAWQNTEKHKRKTLQKQDISQAVASDEMYDFLIDIVPREEPKKTLNQVLGSSELNVATTESKTITLGNGDSQQQFPIVFLAPQEGQQAQTMTLVADPSSTDSDGSYQILQVNPSDNTDLASGTVVQATPIGQPIQLPATSGGQPLQLIALNLPDGNIQQFQVQLPPTS